MTDADFCFGCEELFSSPEGNGIYYNIISFCEKYNLINRIKQGVLVGLSGGADSILLLIFLWKLQKDLDFPLSAMHINHMIRGGDADADESFSKEVCRKLGIRFFAERYDVPAIARARGCGLEECARDVRYEAFGRMIESTPDLNVIAVAHNASDNTETFIFNAMRGSGLNGLCAIAPERDGIIRPLLGVSKSRITALLDGAGIPYATDKTNASEDYTRNYIRGTVIPTLYRLSPDPDRAIERVTSSLKKDRDFLLKLAREAYNEALTDNGLDNKSIAKLDIALLSRVIVILCHSAEAPTPERVHIDAIAEHLMLGGRFTVDIPGGFSFISDGRYSRVAKKACGSDEKCFDEQELEVGLNEIDELGIAILISYDKEEIISSNVYNFSNKVQINSAIIVGKLTVRTRRDGDKYRFGGMTRRVKRLFSDKKIPEDKRNTVPLICDGDGILYIPGFRVRDGAAETCDAPLWITIYKKEA